MAVNSYDPTDGHPVFLGTDAPDIKVDPTKVSEYAAEVGTRLIGSTAERDAYAYAREGLGWYDTDLNQEMIHNGTGWVSIWRDTGWVEVTVNSGWTEVEPVAYRVVNRQLHVVGRVNGDGTSTAVIFNIPAPYRHTRANTVFFAEGSRTLGFTTGGDVQCAVPAAGVRDGVILSAVSTFVG